MEEPTGPFFDRTASRAAGCNDRMAAASVACPRLVGGQLRNPPTTVRSDYPEVSSAAVGAAQQR